MTKKSIGKTVLGSALAAALVVPGLPAIAFAGDAASTPQSAPTIEFGKSYTDEINDYSETDYFRVVIPADGKLTVSFKKDYNEGTSSWDIRLLSEDLSRTVFSRTYNTETAKTEQVTTGIKAGTYYLKVNGYRWDTQGRPYTIKADFTKSDFWENELNDDPSEAKELIIGKKVEGTVISDGDNDWYRFTVPSDGYYSIGFGRKYGNSREAWLVKIYNYDQSNALSENRFYNSNSSTTLIAYNFSKGTYYVHVEDYFSNRHGSAYSIAVNSVKTPTAPSITSTKGKSQGIQVKWKAVKGASGYQVRLSTKGSSGFTDEDNYVSGQKKTSATLSSYRIQSKQKVYVQVRSYKSVGDDKVYSKWSAKKSARAK